LRSFSRGSAAALPSSSPPLLGQRAGGSNLSGHHRLLAGNNLSHLDIFRKNNLHYQDNLFLHQKI
jgi:hypothetical protein